MPHRTRAGEPISWTRDAFSASGDRFRYGKVDTLAGVRPVVEISGVTVSASFPVVLEPEEAAALAVGLLRTIAKTADEQEALRTLADLLARRLG